MEIKIESGIPIPERGISSQITKACTQFTAINQSFFFPIEDKKKQNTAKVAACNWAGRNKCKIITRTVTENSIIGVRVWLVENKS